MVYMWRALLRVSILYPVFFSVVKTTIYSPSMSATLVISLELQRQSFVVPILQSSCIFVMTQSNDTLFHYISFVYGKRLNLAPKGLISKCSLYYTYLIEFVQ